MADFFAGKRIFVTGHTGFKGAWLCLWLHSLGASVTGYALDPPTTPNLFDLARIGSLLNNDIRADIRDLPQLSTALAGAAPELVFHLAAQPLVRESYRTPVETYATNIMGTVHLLEAIRHTPSVRAVVNVTSDKCYDNRERLRGYREEDAMGGHDPYSSSKGCAELVTAAYRASFFTPEHRVAVASARAGNVIGGGDWACDRLVPDILRALLAGEAVSIRNPQAIRPWQHVLEPLSGYLLLARHLLETGDAAAQGWNFGPRDEDAKTVEWIVQRLCTLWGDGARYVIEQGQHPHEARSLRLDSSKARQHLGWQSRWELERALTATVEWIRAYQAEAEIRDICLRQIAEYGNLS